MRTIYRHAITLLGFFFIIAPLAAQDGKEDLLRSEGATYMQKGEWANAVKTFSKLTEIAPTDKTAWFQLGYAHHAQGAYLKAISSYEKMLAVPGFHPLNATTMYNTACAYSLKGETDKAFDWLEKCVAAGFSGTAQITSDTDLIPLRTSPRFGEIVRKVDRNANPCAYIEGTRDLDFWIGSWECYNPAGQMAGRNVITRALNDCVIEENWSGSLGTNGRSFNYFDQNDGMWHQTWVDNKGGSLTFVGTIVNTILGSAMVYERTSTDAEGATTDHQMILAPQEDGTVTQEAKVSTDGGETWTSSWVLTYHRTGSPTGSPTGSE